MHIILSLLLVGAMAVPANAAFEGPGAAPVVKSSASVASAPKDSPVQLEGNIVRQVKGDRYIFKDSSGEVLVEIDDDLMANRNITPDTKVRLRGEVDRKKGKNSVEVDMLEVLN